MTLTRAGKAMAMMTLGGGVTNTSSNTASNTALQDTGGVTRYIATNIPSAHLTQIMYGYKCVTQISLGTGLLSDDTYGVYSLQNENNFNLQNYDQEGFPVQKVFDIGNGTTTLIVPITNSGSESVTYTHYGLKTSNLNNNSGLAAFSAINSSSNAPTTNLHFLLSYYEFPEPITIAAGETKTIQVTIDVSNL